MSRERFLLLGFKHFMLLLGFFCFVALLSPNVAYFLNIDVDLVPFLDSPILFFWDCLEVLMMAHPFLLVILTELVLLALVGRYSIWIILHLPFFLWLPLELIYIQRYGAPSSAHILAIIAQTNYAEALGYAGGWGNLALYSIYVVFLFLVVLGMLRSGVKWGHRSRWWVVSIFGTLIIINFLSHKDFSDQSKKIDDIKDLFVAREFGYGVDEYIDSYPFGLVLRILRYFQQLNVLRASAETVAAIDSGLSRREVAEREIYVVVIGESARADRWSLNGYDRETTPLLSKKSNVFSFTNAVSVSAATRTAVPALLSRTTVNDLAFSRLRNSWITDFKKSGFKVYWLSTQMQVGSHDTMIGVYASLADETLYLNEGMYKTKGNYDGVVLEYLKKILKRSDEFKKLIVIHTLGSHFPYHFRYPLEFAHFKPVPPQNKVGNLFDKKQEKELQNAYDNSIRYTDFVLSSIIDALREYPDAASMMWYLSDHGQTLFEIGCTANGHGFRSAYNFHIPVVLWASDTFLSFRPEIAWVARRNRDQPLYAGDFFDTMLDVGGFENNGRLNSFLSEGYDTRPRIVTVQGDKKINFDEEFVDEGCAKI